MKMIRTTILSAALLGLFAGCSSAPKVQDANPHLYPSRAARSQVLDVQVLKRSTEIEFTNTSSRAFGACSVWLNARYRYDLASIAVGQTFVLPLVEFKDEFGDNFRPGGFWAAEDPEQLVLTQIETTNAEGKIELVGLITIREDE